MIEGSVCICHISHFFASSGRSTLELCHSRFVTLLPPTFALKILLIKTNFIWNRYLSRLHFSCLKNVGKEVMLFLSESSYPFACLSSLFLVKGLKSLEKVFWHYVCWRCILCFTGKNHPFSSWWLSFWETCSRFFSLQSNSSFCRHGGWLHSFPTNLHQELQRLLPDTHFLNSCQQQQFT